MVIYYDKDTTRGRGGISDEILSCFVLVSKIVSVWGVSRSKENRSKKRRKDISVQGVGEMDHHTHVFKTPLQCDWVMKRGVYKERFKSLT